METVGTRIRPPLTWEGLLLTKRTVREKDVADRLVLERAIAEIKTTRQGGK